MTTEDQFLDQLDEAQEIIPFTYSITSYGADYPVDSLVKRMDKEDIIVPTLGNEDQLIENNIDAFQREYVWSRSKADRFIESLLLGLPVPGIFLVKEDTGRFLVLDGHQRLYTLRCFYNGIIHGREYRLTGIQERFNDKTYQQLDTEDRRRLDDSIIHAIIIKQVEPTEDLSSIYSIFERLNTGGVTLQPQEIRMALYRGEFAKLLRELNSAPEWRALIGPASKRLKDIELILRFFALLYYSDSYTRPMNIFLNRYMATNKMLVKQNETELRSVFLETVAKIFSFLGKDAFKPERSVNTALADAIMVAVGKKVLNKETITSDQLVNARCSLLQDKEFIEAISTGTSQEAKVDLRINRAISSIG